jgi:hypothetical protein
MPRVPALVGDVEVADTVHRHTAGVVEVGEWQHARGGEPAASFST